MFEEKLSIFGSVLDVELGECFWDRTCLDKGLFWDIFEIKFLWGRVEELGCFEVVLRIFRSFYEICRRVLVTLF